MCLFLLDIADTTSESEDADDDEYEYEYYDDSEYYDQDSPQGQCKFF